jgi:hypothetical protein
MVAQKLLSSGMCLHIVNKSKKKKKKSKAIAVTGHGGL